jgi:hypothetical protein
MDDISIDLSRLLSTNDVPTVQEETFVRHEIDQLSEQMIRVLETRLQKHQAIISQVRRLLPELLGHTFSTATAGDQGTWAGKSERS